MTGPAFEAVHRIASVPHLLVALDFDGTLAPTVDDPEAARALPESTAAIDALVHLPATTVAFVSGRSLAGLSDVAAAPPEVILVGSHGAESLVSGKETGPTLTQKEQELVEALCLAVDTVATRFSGARVERKPSGMGLHTRLSSTNDAEAARAESLRAVEELPGSEQISERYGKDILEFTVRAADKGSALAWLREHSTASAVLFIGDDVTDEDGFRALTVGDVGVKVGTGDTAAEYRVSDPREVSELLSALVHARTQ